MSEDYGVIKTPPEFHFDTVYEAKFEMSEESASELKKLMHESDEDAIRFYDVFEHDLICCLNNKCENCHLRIINDRSCQDVLEENARKMIQNQRRMYIEFMRRRNDGE